MAAADGGWSRVLGGITEDMTKRQSAYCCALLLTMPSAVVTGFFWRSVDLAGLADH